MGWRLAISGLPDGYQVLEKEDGLTLLDPAGRVVAEFGPMLSDLSVIVKAAWDDAQQPVEG